MPCRSRARLFRWGLVAGLCSASAAWAQPVALGEELQRLRNQYNFDVKGEEHLEEATGRSEGEDLLARLRLLLERFDHVIVQDSSGGVERIIILGRTTSAPAPPMVVVTPPGGPPAAGGGTTIELKATPAGAGQMVEVSLEGPGDKRVTLSLLADTGAEMVVLPRSLIPQLGLKEADLAEAQVHTANGTASARTGRLAGVWLGTTKVADVGVAFLDDDKLGVSGLLGRSVLGRYEVTFAERHIKLTPKAP